MTNERTPPVVNLVYRIASCTDYSGKYVPEHILIDAPTDQTSRWSGANQTAHSRQWIILELRQPSLVHSITFGKFHKAHPCNMKEFKVYVGRTLDRLTLALHAGLNNDNIPETFDLRCPNEAGLQCPIKFVKIVPLSAHSPSFHTSIWYVALKGINEQVFVKEADDAYASYKETSAVRHVMKYLRQRRHLSAFNALQTRTGVILEHPIVSNIYKSLMSGDWLSLEPLIKMTADNGLFDGYISASDPKALWTRLNGANADGDVPSPRGGHQLCIDSAAGVIYLFGGWDGEKNLDDFWVYAIYEGRWRLLSASTAADGGPGARSCHKMVFDHSTGYIYVLGRLADGDGPTPPSTSDVATQAQPQDDSASTVSVAGSASRVVTNAAPEQGPRPLPSDFYRYTTRGSNSRTWTLLSKNTAAENGPPLLHDHQMEIDSDKQILYVFGGRILNGDPDSGTSKCSGLYRYHITTDIWEHVMDDSGSSQASSRTIPSRYGHSMVFDPRSRRLFIFGGKKSDYLADMHIFDTRSQEVTEVTSDFSTSGGPDPCFCQRAVIDHESGHIFLLPGLSKPKGHKNSASDGTLRSTFWIYQQEKTRWTQISNARAQAYDPDWSAVEDILQPQPRYAHQMVYDSSQKKFFVHGGNSGQDSNKRLDDFWSMTFERPSREEMVRRATFAIRRQHFRELCETVPAVQALTFLQRDVHAVVDHLSAQETATFRGLHSHLFSSAAPSFRAEKSIEDEDIEIAREPDTDITPGSRKTMPPIPELNKDVEGDVDPKLTPERFRQRTQVFEDLLELINAEDKQPVTDLTGLVEGMQEESL